MDLKWKEISIERIFSMSPLTLSVLPDQLCVCRLAPTQALPGWATQSQFFAITRTLDELSIVCPTEQVPAAVKSQPGWRALKVEGPLDFSLIGILAGIASSLAEAGISLFAISTFDTDYILVQKDNFEQAIHVLRTQGYQVV